MTFSILFMTFLDFPPPVWPLQVQRDRSILSLFTHSLTHWRASSGIRVGSRRQPWLWEWYLSKYYNCYDADFAYSVSLSRSLRILDWEQSWFHTPALTLGVISILDPGGVRPAGKIQKIMRKKSNKLWKCIFCILFTDSMYTISVPLGSRERSQNIVFLF